MPGELPVPSEKRAYDFLSSGGQQIADKLPLMEYHSDSRSENSNVDVLAKLASNTIMNLLKFVPVQYTVD